MNSLTIYPIIRRDKGWYRNVFNIKISHMDKRHQDILTSNRFIKKFSGDDRFIQTLFYIADMEAKNKFSRTYWPNPFTGEITTYNEILENYDILPWPCAICGTEINVRIGVYKWKEFCCSDCKSTKLPKQMVKVDDRIANSSLAFTKYTKKVLQKRQKEILKKLKRNTNI